MLHFKTIVIGTILLFITLVVGPYVAIQFNYIASPVPLGWFRYFGVVMMLFGAPLAVWCAFLLLVPGHGHPVPYDSPEGLNPSGPYKYTRNPFMTGWLFVLWGEAVFLRSVPLFAYAGILTLCVHFWILAYEEPALEDRYGDEYRRYKVQVPRWLPKMKNRMGQNFIIIIFALLLSTSIVASANNNCDKARCDEAREIKRLIYSSDHYERLHGLIVFRSADAGIFKDLIPKIMEIGRKDTSAEVRAYAIAAVREYRCWIGARRYSDKETTDFLIKSLADKSKEVVEEALHSTNPTTIFYSPCDDHPKDIADAEDHQNIPLRDSIQSARSFLAEKKADSALEVVDGLLKNKDFSWDYAWNILQLANELQRAKEQGKAIELLQKLSAVKDLGYNDVDDVGFALIEFGDAATALDLAQRTISAGQKSFKVYFMMAEAYKTMSNWPEAEKNYRLALPPPYDDYYISLPPSFFHNYALALMLVEKYEESFKQINRAIKKYGDRLNANALYIRGYDYLNLEKPDIEKAIEDFQKTIDMDPSDAKFYLGLADAYKSAKRYEEALEKCKQAIELDVDKQYLEDIYNHFARLYKAMGQNDLYKETLIKAKEVEKGK